MGAGGWKEWVVKSSDDDLMIATSNNHNLVLYKSNCETTVGEHVGLQKKRVGCS